MLPQLVTACTTTVDVRENADGMPTPVMVGLGPFHQYVLAVVHDGDMPGPGQRLPPHRCCSPPLAVFRSPVTLYRSDSRRTTPGRLAREAQGPCTPSSWSRFSRRRLSMESIARLLAENLSVIAVWLSGQTALSSLTVTRASQPRERLASSVLKL
jgi:hypothetical protein